MPKYKYTVKNRTGSTIRGEEFAASQKELIMALRAKNLIILSIEESQAKQFTHKKSSDIPTAGGIGKIKTFDMAIFFKQLAAMVKGGLPLIRALEILVDETKNRALRNCLQLIVRHINDGHSLSDGFKLFPHLFTGLIIAIVEAGEKIGALDTMLERLSDYLQAQDRLNRKLFSSMAYPMFMLGFFLVLMIAITFFLIPSFQGIYDGLGANLPAITGVLFDISDFLKANMVWLLIGTVVSTFLGFQIFFKMPRGKYLRDVAILKIPLFGTILLKATVGKFCKTLSTLLAEGIAVPEAFDLSAKTSGSLPLAEAGLKASKLILEGDTIPDALKKIKVFPSLMVQMVAVGVESGNLPEMLDKSARFYEDQVDVFISVMLSLLEPILIVGLGLTFGFVAIALYLPMFRMGAIISGADGF